MARCTCSIAWVAIILMALSVGGNGFVIEKKFTEICGHNLTLAEPNESLKIDFNVPNGRQFLEQHSGNCTSFIIWSGSPDYKLLPFTARSDYAMSGVDAQPEVVLSITDIKGKVIKLEMFGSKPFYLSVTPVQKKIVVSQGGQQFRRCPDLYIGCGQHMCIHGQFMCDSIAQCANDEVACFDMPTNYFLAMSFVGVMFAFGLVSFLLALYVYLRFYRNTVFLLSADYKPQYYGTVNGSFDSSNSFASLLRGQATSPSSKTQFYENIQTQYSETLNHGQK